MREDICSVPVSEIFEKNDGCPICRMRDTVEQRLLDYILGAAMMEPDVRQMTNREGFCHRHYRMMALRHSRLPLALMIESRLAEIDRTVFGDGKLIAPPAKKGAAKAEKETEGCFLCSRIESSMGPLISTVVRLYDKQMDFRELFEGQSTLCLPHYSALAAAADREMSKRFKGEFITSAAKKAQGELKKLRADVEHFCSMFDYRNNTEDADWGDSKDSIERSICFMTAFDPGDRRF